jgi:hypothetical protein
MRFAFGALVFVLGMSAVNAAEVYLKDGSIVIGTIQGLADGEDLDVDTEYMGVVTIEWDGIDQIRGTRIVDVELFDGRRIFGKIVLNEDGLSIIGDDTQIVQLTEIFEINEVNETFWESLDVYTDLGTNVIRGNNQVTQLSFGGGIGYNARNFEVSIDGTTIINEQTNAQDLLTTGAAMDCSSGRGTTNRASRGDQSSVAPWANVLSIVGARGYSYSVALR